MNETKDPIELPPLVERMLPRLIRAFAPERIALFGSYAKRSAHERSDVDLLVITRFEGDPLRHQRRARQLCADCFPRVDVVFATPEDVAMASTAKSPFLASILGTCVTLYARRIDSAPPLPKPTLCEPGPRGRSAEKEF